MKVISEAVTTILWDSVMNKLYYGRKFWYVTILFSSNKLLKLKYIHHYFFLKFLTKKSWCVLWAGKYGILFLFAGRNSCQSYTNKRNAIDKTTDRGCCIDYASKYNVYILNYVLYSNNVLLCGLSWTY